MLTSRSDRPSVSVLLTAVVGIATDLCNECLSASCSEISTVRCSNRSALLKSSLFSTHLLLLSSEWNFVTPVITYSRLLCFSKAIEYLVGFWNALFLHAIPQEKVKDDKIIINTV